MSSVLKTPNGRESTVSSVEGEFVAAGPAGRPRRPRARSSRRDFRLDRTAVGRRPRVGERIPLPERSRSPAVLAALYRAVDFLCERLHDHRRQLGRRLRLEQRRGSSFWIWWNRLGRSVAGNGFRPVNMK